MHSQALRERLAQGSQEPFIAGLLGAQTAEGLANYLLQTMGGYKVPKSDPVELLIRYLKMLRVRKLRLADFAPSKPTIELSDVDLVVGEFHEFVTSALEAGEDDLPVVELE